MRLETDDDARAYANAVSDRTRSTPFIELTLRSFEDLPLRSQLSPEERVLVEGLRAEHADRIAPPQMSRSGDEERSYAETARR